MTIFDAPSVQVGKEDKFIAKVLKYISKRSKKQKEIPIKDKTPVKLISCKRVNFAEVQIVFKFNLLVLFE